MGMPRGRSLPFDLGIHTRRTGLDLLSSSFVIGVLSLSRTFSCHGSKWLACIGFSRFMLVIPVLFLTVRLY